jgi:hypothetical protein
LQQQLATEVRRRLRLVEATPQLTKFADIELPSTLFTRPPNTGDCTSVAIFTPGGRTSMP